MNYESRKNDIKFPHFLNFSKGISLIELILVVAIISILGASATSFGSSFLIRNNLENKTNEVISSLRTAQLNAISSKEDREWGVDTNSNQIKLFAVGDAGFDQTFSVSSNTSISTENIIFDKLTGNPDAVATITVSNNIGESNTITVNEVGIVDVN